jgi:hypothetical protein
MSKMVNRIERKPERNNKVYVRRVYTPEKIFFNQGSSNVIPERQMNDIKDQITLKMETKSNKGKQKKNETIE